ncbi:conserved Plasmodium protein, unknown function [Plasmodium relictum]|uniref:SAC3/GANP/THP3 conserved domain-containing protein n=1 Tax=Plasmodium relictum TaxID=85471 RepID=A0A1J1HCF7_PLARL|nr:conserved Plasmodium protein, unknown function [Plasmodium relictum]CRH01108.1 conserved Plasmodium protein, unknown function [Plasmodium relictum]
MNEKRKDGMKENNSNNKESTSFNSKNCYQNKNDLNKYLYNTPDYSNYNTSGSINNMTNFNANNIQNNYQRNNIQNILNYNVNNNGSNNMNFQADNFINNKNYINNLSDVNKKFYDEEVNKYASKHNQINNYQNNNFFYNRNDNYYQSLNNSDNLNYNYVNMYNKKNVHNLNTEKNNVEKEENKNDLSYYMNNNDSYVELYINKVKEIYYFHVFYHYLKLGFPEKEAAIESKKYIFITLNRYFLLVKNAILSSPESVKQINNCVSSNLLYYQQQTNLQQFLLQQQSNMQNFNSPKLNLHDQMNINNFNIGNINLPIGEQTKLEDLPKLNPGDISNNKNNNNLHNNTNNNNNNYSHNEKQNNNDFQNNPVSCDTNTINLKENQEKQNNLSNYYNLKADKINDMIDCIEEMKKINKKKKERKTFSDYPPMQALELQSNTLENKYNFNNAYNNLSNYINNNNNNSDNCINNNKNGDLFYNNTFNLSNTADANKSNLMKLNENNNEEIKKKISFTINKSKNKIFQIHNRSQNDKSHKTLSEVSEVSELSDDNKNEKQKEKSKFSNNIHEEKNTLGNNYKNMYIYENINNNNNRTLNNNVKNDFNGMNINNSIGNINKLNNAKEIDNFYNLNNVNNINKNGNNVLNYDNNFYINNNNANYNASKNTNNFSNFDTLNNYSSFVNNNHNFNKSMNINKYNYNNSKNLKIANNLCNPTHKNISNNVIKMNKNNTIIGAQKYNFMNNKEENNENKMNNFFKIDYATINEKISKPFVNEVYNNNNYENDSFENKVHYTKNNYIEEGKLKYRNKLEEKYIYENKQKNIKEKLKDELESEKSEEFDLEKSDDEYNSEEYEDDIDKEEDTDGVINYSEREVNKKYQINNKNIKINKLSNLHFFQNKNEITDKFNNFKTYVKNVNEHFREHCKNKEFSKCLKIFIKKLYSLKKKNKINSSLWIDNILPTVEDVLSKNVYFFLYPKRLKRKIENNKEMNNDLIGSNFVDKKIKLSQQEIERREKRKERFYDISKNKKSELIENSFYIDEDVKDEKENDEDMNLDKLIEKYNYSSCYKNKNFVGECKNIQKFFFRLTSLPEKKNVRSFSVLKCTYAYILYKYNIDKNYKYINEQFRSLRQDLNIQNIFHNDVINIYETNIRICIVNNDLFQFLQCINKLFELYQRLNIKKSKVEFLCYKLIYLTLQNMHQEFLIEYLTLSEEEKNHENIQLCYYLNECIKNKMYLININMISPLDAELNHKYIYYRIFLNNHILKYLPSLMSLSENAMLNVNINSLVSFVKNHGKVNDFENNEIPNSLDKNEGVKMPYLTNYLIVLFLPKYRLLALINICKTSIKVNISTLTKLLNFENDEQCLKFLNEVNTIISNNEVLSKSSLVNLMKSPLLKNKYINHIR